MALFTNRLSITILLLLGLLIATHAYVCNNPSLYAGKTVCDFSGGYCGECVSFVKKCTGDARQTRQWIQGEKVRGANIASGTSIATFRGGRYSGHAAIYISQNNLGIQVYDQWTGRPVGFRTIRWNGNGISNNGNSFHVIN